jgi:xanthine dehydrogenase molybdenum-binding subunit
VETIGRRVRRKDGVAKVSGRELYAHDIILPQMLYAAVLRSPFAHARIRGMETTAAEAMGAVCLTPGDVPDVVYNERIVSIPSKTYRDRRVLPWVARHVGEAVAAVAAATEEEAVRALDAIRVDYEPLPTVLSWQEALAPGAPRLYDRIWLGDQAIDMTDNLACENLIEEGDVERGFREADVIIERMYQTPRQYHGQMETKAAVAAPLPNGGVTVWATVQSVHNVRQVIGHLFGIPLSKVNVKKIALGGSFGSSIQMNSIIPICVALALKSGRPVKLISPREDDMYDHVYYPTDMRLKIGAKRDGTVCAAEMEVYSDIGAHQIQASSLLGVMAGWLASLYKWQNFRFRGHAVYTNKVPACALQGFGNPMVNFAVESQMDILAEQLGMDPLALRLKNYVGQGDVFWAQGPSVKAVIESCGVEELLREGSRLIGWDRREPPSAKSGRFRRGIGMARGFHTSGTAGPRPGDVIDYSSATIKINEDGSVDVMTPVVDHGGGTGEAIVKIVAEALAVPYELVELSEVDTRTTGYDVATHATRGVYCGGGVAAQVAEQVKTQILNFAGRFLEESPERLELTYLTDVGTVIRVVDRPDRRVTLGELAKTAQIKSWGTMAATGSLRQPTAPPCFMAHFVEVEVDTETGRTQVVRAALLSDSGTVINPDLLEGQLIGSFARGVGFALEEHCDVDPTTGHLVNDGWLTDYRMGTAADMPPNDAISTYFAQTYEPTGPFGAKGVAEAALSSVQAAVANAVYNATGVRIQALPITPEVLLEALDTAYAVSR